MKVLDTELDNSPTENSVRGMAELRIRNLLCYRELKARDDGGKYENIRPFLVRREEVAELRRLWNSDREEFMREYTNCRTNARRYRALLKRDNIADPEKEKYMTLLMKHQERELIFKEIYGNEPNNSNL